MNIQERNKLFTDKVNFYISHGYTIRPEVTNSSDGTMKIDLENKTWYVRVMMRESYESKYENNILDFIVLAKKKSDLKRRAKADYILWQNELDVIEKKVFIKISNNFYLSEQEYNEQEVTLEAKKHYRYYNTRHEKMYGKRITFDDRAKSIVLPYIRRQPKCKTTKLSDIQNVTKTIRHLGYNSKEYEIEYRIDTRKKSYCLKQTFTKSH